MNVDPNGTNWWSDFWTGVGEWFADVGEWFAETLWQDLIVDKFWNNFIIGTLWERGLKPFGIALWDIWGKISSNEIVNYTVAIGGLITTVVGAFVSTPIVVVAGLIVGAFDFLLWFRDLFSKEGEEK